MSRTSRPGPDLPRRLAVLSVHTSPLDQPGTADAGGMNVYIVEVAKRLAAAGVEVEIFTRATASELPPCVELADGVLVRHVTAGPYEGLNKADLPAQLCGFTAGVLRAEAARPPGWYDLIHSHYWLSGQVAWVAKERWRVPLVHTAHTLARVKNTALAAGDSPEPTTRILGEEQVVAVADRLVANTAAEAGQLVAGYGADPDRVDVVPPGVDLDRFSPGDRAAARRRFGLPPDAAVLLFVGRIQPLKAPDLVLRAAAELRTRNPELARRLVVVICGGPSGTGLARPNHLRELADRLDLAGTRFLPALPADELADLYRAADLLCVPSYNESFGLVAVEAQACGVPVVAAAVGGLVTAVADDRSGVLVEGHVPAHWAAVLGELLADPVRRDRLARGAVAHATRFSWERTTSGLLAVYGAALAEQRAGYESEYEAAVG